MSSTDREGERVTHTPGPWEVDDPGEGTVGMGEGLTIISQNEGTWPLVAECLSPSRQEADARLIADRTPAEESDFDYDDEDGGDCFHCGGDGWVECNDPIECTRAHRTYTGGGGYFGQLCRCSSCGGSGAAKDMTIW
jgi:hypothetical protein